MSTANINQILLRNIDLLEGQMPLLVNLDGQVLIPEWLTHYPNANITYFSTNFAQYQAVKAIEKRIQGNFFDSYYQGSIKHDLVVISFPKSKAELAFTLAMLAPSLTDDCVIVVVGENKSGIKSLNKLSSDYLKHCIKQDSARHCLLYTAQYIDNSSTFRLEDWFSYYEIVHANQTIKIAALPGVFSQKGLDKGTQVLLSHIPAIKADSLLDFGCGAGVISAAIATQNPQIELTLVDVSALALASSRETLSINKLNGECIASDALSHVSGHFDTIVSNPPFHQGLKTHYAATESFLTHCAKHLKRSGELFVVANSFLKYQPIMESAIGRTSQVIVQQGFTVYRSART